MPAPLALSHDLVHGLGLELQNSCANLATGGTNLPNLRQHKPGRTARRSVRPLAQLLFLPGHRLVATWMNEKSAAAAAAAAVNDLLQRCWSKRCWPLCNNNRRNNGALHLLRIGLKRIRLLQANE